MSTRGRSRRTAHRYRWFLLLGAGLALALGSYWLLRVLQNDAVESVPDARRNEHDYFVEKFNFVRMSKTGEARYNVAGSRMIHRPQDDTYEITLPVIHNFTPGRPPLRMRAERAIALPGNDRIDMIDQVEANRPASAETELFNLKSPFLQIFPDEDVLRTDTQVNLTLGDAKMTGAGMYVNNATREFRLAQQVRANFPPRPAAPASP